ncbi:MAG: hypothetical protein DHS20C19_10970 [Acidimicrobiales bacterium]|nr:MAG: hypothetical protein DHS20C19_10970 [Acidimicrobiales bacterium]
MARRRWEPQPRPPFVEGERLFIPCTGGGPSASRLVTYPPPLEIEERTGLYVLNDDGEEGEWVYEFVPRQD